MLDFANVRLNNVILHKLGNKSREEDMVLSDKELSVNDSIKELLMQFFLGHFAEENYYNFFSENGPTENPVYQYVNDIFQNPGNFVQESVNIAQKLYDAGTHPKIKEGDLYVAYFSDLVVDGELVDAVGIFKSETKQDFLQIKASAGGLDIVIEEGINLNKIDKACLIYNTEAEFGYKLNIIDATNKQEAQYWRLDFLGIEQRKDDFYQTQKYMELCKDFVEEVYNEEHEVEKPQQIAAVVYVDRGVIKIVGCVFSLFVAFFHQPVKGLLCGCFIRHAVEPQHAHELRFRDVCKIVGKIIPGKRPDDQPVGFLPHRSPCLSRFRRPRSVCRSVFSSVVSPHFLKIRTAYTVYHRTARLSSEKASKKPR